MKWTCLFPALALLLSACNQQRADFESIQLGKPLPRQFAPATQPTKDGALALWCEHGDWPVPAIVAAKHTAALMEPSGVVTAKYYAELALGHWGLAQSSAIQSFLEVQVPPECFVEPPGPDADEFFRQIGEIKNAGRALSDGMPAGQRTIIEFGQEQEKAYVYSVQMPVNLKRGKTEELKKPGNIIAIGEASELDHWLDLSGVDTKAFSAKTTQLKIERNAQGLFLTADCKFPKTNKTIIDCVETVDRQLGRVSYGGCQDANISNIYYSLIFYGLIMYSGGHRGNDMGSYWPFLRGITQAGFDVTIKSDSYSQVRIHNMGNRIIRVEHKTFRIVDPFCFAFMLESTGQEPRPQIVDR